MSNEFDRIFDEARRETKASHRQNAKRQERIRVMCAEGAAKCAQRIRDIMLKDEQLKGAFTPDIPPFSAGEAFNCYFLGKNVNIRIQGSVVYDGSRTTALPNPDLDPLWTAFVAKAALRAKAKEKESSVHRVDADFNVSGDPVFNIVDAVIQAGQDVARQ